MGAGSFDKVLYEVSGGVATVTLNDPEKRNMLSGAMLTEVVAAMETARDSNEVRAVVLTGEAAGAVEPHQVGVEILNRARAQDADFGFAD